MTTTLDVRLSGPSREGKIGYFATALVKLGEAAVLGVHRVAQRPVVRDGEIVVREMASGLVLGRSPHHRRDAGDDFLLHVIDQLQRPQLGWPPSTSSHRVRARTIRASLPGLINGRCSPLPSG
ncbi:MAG: 2-oxo acid dehydrogenase subunit E2 [Candidatus Cryosericum sp.]